MKRERITVFASLIIGLVVAFSLYGYYARARRAEVTGMNITGNISQTVKVHAMTKWGTPITITLRPESTSYTFYDPDNSSDKLNNTGEMISYCADKYNMTEDQVVDALYAAASMEQGKTIPYESWTLVQQPKAVIDTFDLSVQTNLWSVALRAYFGPSSYMHLDYRLGYINRTQLSKSRDAEKTMKYFFDKLAAGKDPSDAYKMTKSERLRSAGWEGTPKWLLDNYRLPTPGENLTYGGHFDTGANLTGEQASTKPTTTFDVNAELNTNESIFACDIALGYDEKAQGMPLATDMSGPEYPSDLVWGNSTSDAYPDKSNIGGGKLIQASLIRVEWGYIAIYTSPSLGNIQTSAAIPLMDRINFMINAPYHVLEAFALSSVILLILVYLFISKRK